MKKKISIKATIETKNNFVKINKRTNSNILILEKKFVLPVQKIIKNIFLTIKLIAFRIFKLNKKK